MIAPTFSESYYGVKIVPHSDLIRFGADQTLKAPATKFKENRTLLSEAFLDAELPDILPADSGVFIEVVYNQMLNRRKRQKVKVDRQTGYPIEGEGDFTIFSLISRFDPDTLPEDRASIPLSSVGYWTKQNEYISPSVSN